MSYLNFVHLDVHTEYSLLESTIRIKELVNKAASFEMPAVAMTDSFNISGAVDFFLEAQKRKIKPIIGCKIQVVVNNHKPAGNKSDKALYSLILLVENETGYKNLCKLVTAGQLQSLPNRPSISLDMLAVNTEGLIGISSCVQGNVWSDSDINTCLQILKVAKCFKESFGDNNFFLELQDHGLAIEDAINQDIVKIGEMLSLPLVAGNNCRYLENTDFIAHEILLGIKTKLPSKDPRRQTFPSSEYYFKSSEEMYELFCNIPEAFHNTTKIAERCNFKFDFSQNRFPIHPVPAEYTSDSYLEQKAEEGLDERLKIMSAKGMKFDPDIYWKRLADELTVIRENKLSSIFLIAWDIAQHARESRIMLGPGTGAAPASLVNYVLRITKLDPIEHGLMFERFLSPLLRKPYFNFDFPQNYRDKTINNLVKKLGGQNVIPISTFSDISNRMAIRETGRFFGLPCEEIGKIVKHDNEPEYRSLWHAENPTREDLIKEIGKIEATLKTAEKLRGLYHYRSIYSSYNSGVVIGLEPLANYLALCTAHGDKIATQYPSSAVDGLGFFTVSIREIKSLTIIGNTIRLIWKNQKTYFDFDDIPKNDLATFKLIGEGRTAGITYLENLQKREILKKIQPSRFEDIAAFMALYRPGPMESGMLDDYIKRKQGTSEANYVLPQLKDILQETYGIILYPEQIVKIASVLAGFSLNDGYLLYLAMIRRKPEGIAQQRKKFLEGSKNNQILLPIAEEIFALLEQFSGYAFMKSHSAACAHLAYQLAYLKANYPLEFFAASVATHANDTDKINKYMLDFQEIYGRTKK